MFVQKMPIEMLVLLIQRGGYDKPKYFSSTKFMKRRGEKQVENGLASTSDILPTVRILLQSGQWYQII